MHTERRDQMEATHVDYYYRSDRGETADTTMTTTTTTIAAVATAATFTSSISSNSRSSSMLHYLWAGAYNALPLVDSLPECWSLVAFEDSNNNNNYDDYNSNSCDSGSGVNSDGAVQNDDDDGADSIVIDTAVTAVAARSMCHEKAKEHQRPCHYYKIENGKNKDNNDDERIVSSSSNTHSTVHASSRHRGGGVTCFTDSELQRRRVQRGGIVGIRTQRSCTLSHDDDGSNRRGDGDGDGCSDGDSNSGSGLQTGRSKKSTTKRVKIKTC